MRRIFALAAAAGLLWGAGLTSAAVASQQEESPQPTINVSPTCGAVTFEFVNPTEDEVRFQHWHKSENMAKADQQDVFVDPDTTETVTLNFDEDSGTYLVKWRAKYPRGNPPGWQQTTVESNCKQPASSAVVSCEAGGAVVTLDNTASAKPVRFIAETHVGGDVVEHVGPTVPAGETRDVTLPMDEDVDTRVFVVSEGDILYDQNHVLDCVQDESPSPSPTPSPTDEPGDELTEVVPVKPDVRQPTCDVPGAIVVPDVEGVLYRDGNGKAVEPGTYEVAEAGDYPATAEPAEGFEFPEDATAEWMLTVDEAPKDCETPTPTPTGDTVPAADDSDEDKGGALPLTGSPLRLLGAVALALIAAGAATLGGVRLLRNRA